MAFAAAHRHVLIGLVFPWAQLLSALLALRESSCCRELATVGPVHHLPLCCCRLHDLLVCGLIEATARSCTRYP